jgi:hypothetical protein
VTIEPRKILSITLDVNALLYFSTAAIVGVQIIYFGLFAMAVAEKMRMRAPARVADRLFRWASLHSASALGLGLVVLGLGGALYAIVEWGHASFGALFPSRMMRITIPAVTTLAIGMQMLFGTLLLGFIDIER